MPRLKNPREKGDDIERKVLDWLGHGEKCYAVRTPGSRGPVDFMVLQHEGERNPIFTATPEGGRTYFLLVRSNRWPDPKERAEAAELADRFAVPLFALRWNDRSKDPAVADYRDKTWVGID